MQLTQRVASQAADQQEQDARRATLQFRIWHTLRACIAIVVGMAAVLYALRDHAPIRNVLAWIGLMLAVMAWRLIQSANIRSAIKQGSPEGLRHKERTFLASIVVASYVAGSSFWLIALPGDIYAELIVTLISVCFISGGFINTAPNVRYLLLRLSGNAGQGILFWSGLGTGGVPHWDILAIYGGVLYIAYASTRQLLQQMRESLRIRNDNVALLMQSEEDKKLIASALDEAKIANESKSRFLAAASHDLRQPIHALNVFLGTLTFHVTTDDAKRLLGRIKNTVLVLEEQFNSLLDLSRFDVGAVVADEKAFRLDNLVVRVVEELRPQAEAKRLELTAEILPAICRSDPMLIGRLLRNLLDNAVKYTASGFIRVRVCQEAQEFLVEVRDTGAGIPADQQTRIFDEYVQLANPSREGQQGVGLGLAIVKHIDTLLGLRLSLESQLGAGSRFTFIVPAGAADK